MSELLSEEEVKRQLHIPDFRSIKKDQLIEFVSMIPNMDKEVAKTCILQFPHFKEYSNEIIHDLNDLLSMSIKDNRKGSIQAYQSILDDLSMLLKKESLSDDERHYIIDKEVEVAYYISIEEDKKETFVKRVITIAGTIALAAISAGGAILGIKTARNKKV